MATVVREMRTGDKEDGRVVRKEEEEEEYVIEREENGEAVMRWKPGRDDQNRAFGIEDEMREGRMRLRFLPFVRNRGILWSV